MGNCARGASAQGSAERQSVKAVTPRPRGPRRVSAAKNSAIGAAEAKKESKEKVISLLKQVNLIESDFNKFPYQFSGGQRQRIVIARALALNPEILICDESVSALDVSVQAQVLNLLNELKEEFGLTYIFISHDLSVVKYMSDRMVVMQAGKIEEMGDADQIYNKPATEYTQKLIDAIPEGKLEDIKKHLESKGIKVN